MAALVVALAVPSNETWLNTINSQFYLAACVAIIFVSDPMCHRFLRNSILLLAGLTGLVSCLLTPFFIVRYLRNRTAGIQAGILSACTAFHLIVLLKIGIRHSEHHLIYLPEAFLVKSVVLPFLSRVPAVLAGRFAMHHVSTLFLSASFAIFLLLLFFVFKARRVAGSEAFSLCMMGLWIEIISSYGAIDGSSQIITTADGGRYALTCNLLVGLALVLLFMRSAQKRALHTLSKVLLIALILSGLLDYALFWKRLAAGPSWGVEVAYRNHIRTLCCILRLPDGQDFSFHRLTPTKKFPPTATIALRTDMLWS